MAFMQTRLAGLIVVAGLLPACSEPPSPPRPIPHVTVTTPRKEDVVIARQYPCLIKAHHHIEVKTPIKGYVTAIKVEEGQAVKTNDLLFEISSTNDKDRPQDDDQNGPGQIKAPFDGEIGSLLVRQGVAVQTSASLTTLSDNSTIRIDFNVSESRFGEYQHARLGQHPEDVSIELIVNGKKYSHPGKLDITAMNLGPEKGQFTLHADFPNPEQQLRHGQAGIVVVNLMQHDALVIPQKATFENRDERYVYVIDKASVVHRHQIDVSDEVGDLFVIHSGLSLDDKIVLDGLGKVRNGDLVTYDNQ